MKTQLDHDYTTLQRSVTERLVALGKSLTPQQWTAPSLCTGWRVCDVFGHMTYGGVTPMPKVVPVLLFKHRGNLNRGSAIESVRYANRHSQTTVMSEFARACEHPVGIGKTIKAHEFVVDHVVHELDVRRPLLLPTEWLDNELSAVLTATISVKSPLFAPSKTASGLAFRATDIDWRSGDSTDPIVEGPAEDLLLAICGRSAGLATLSGNGVEQLRARIEIGRSSPV